VPPMVKEVSVNQFVYDHDYDHDQQPHPPVGNQMLPHPGSISVRQSFRQASREEDSCLGERPVTWRVPGSVIPGIPTEIRLSSEG
jgi:hypothetical protein